MICTPKVGHESEQLLEVHIFMSRKGSKQRKYSAEFKLSVIMDMREHNLSYRETVRKYWQTHSKREEENHRSQVKIGNAYTWKKEKQASILT